MTENQSHGAIQVQNSTRLESRPQFAASLRKRHEKGLASSKSDLRVAILTGGWDKPYALGLASALVARGIFVDFIGSDGMRGAELLNNPRVNFLNLRGDQNSEATVATKIIRLLMYYCRLVRYSATAEPNVFHILWNNKFQIFDRTLLMLYYKCLGKKVIFTAHNVNAGKRDADDSFLNCLSLKIQYQLSDHIFVHTASMKRELVSDFRVPEGRVSVIPFGINNTFPNTALGSIEAKQCLGIKSGDKTLLFFGCIAPYKGLELLIQAMNLLRHDGADFRLVIAGKPKGAQDYWDRIQQTIACCGIGDQIVERIDWISDEKIELYFKAADVLILPYTRIFQSGVLFLGYSFGLPAIVADVGSLKEEIIEGKTGFVCKPRDPRDLAKVIKNYFDSDLFRNLESTRTAVKEYANKRYSWDKVAAITSVIYSRLLTSNL